MASVDSEPVVEIRDVDVVRGESHLLRSVDWTVRSDERWVLLGPNGAGKTTLLQLAGAQLHPTRGEVRILGETMGAVDVFELRPRIGLTSAALAQRIAPAERVGDVVVSAGYAVIGRWRERYDVHDLTRAAMLMQQWGVSPMAHRPFGTLSEGERKRTQIARALMTDPELLLLDEPGAGLDLGGREDLVTRLSGLARDHYAPAQVLVTHHVEEIPPGYSHALLLREGRVLAAGPTPEVLTDPLLSEAFGLPLQVQRENGRYSARRV
jgi:iron complex transport system ATP-binding protein